MSDISIKDKNSESNFLVELEPGFYVVSTPIGNVGDISLRALEVLKNVDEIYAEDPRVSLKLLKFYDITKSLKIYNDQATDGLRSAIKNKVRSGKSVALISDAGTPLISDPGYKIVRELLEENLEVFAIPGCCAAIAALTSSGLASDKFLFLGFAPRKASNLESFLKKYKKVDASLIFYEAGNRIVKFLDGVDKVFKNPEIVVVKELTKMHETKIRGSIAEIKAALTEDKLLKGEFVVLVREFQEEMVEVNISNDLEEIVKSGQKYLSDKDLSKFISEISGVNKNHIYDLCLKLKS
jgi:16S rRNA (cytidine1402-2'-O)-methyltransferase